MPEIYTQNPTPRVDSLRSQVGDNPQAIAAAFAQQEVQSSQPLAEAISGQDQAINELANLDKQVSSQYQNVSNSAQQQTQNINNMYKTAADMSAYNPNNPQEFIDRGPAQVDLNAFTQTYAPDTGLISPFAVSRSADVQSRGQGNVYSLANQQRGSLERIIGSEAEQMGKIAEYQNNQALLKDSQSQQEFTNALNISKLTGASTFTNPIDGKTYNISDTVDMTATEREKSTKLEEVKNDVLGSMTPRDLFSKYSGSVDFNELMTIYNNNSPFGQAKESMDELRSMYEGGVEDQSTTNELISTVDQLLGENTAPITGMMQIRSLIPGTEAQTAKNIYNKLKGMLSLENRAQLKGSGAISDYEAKVLEQAASELGRNLSDTEFRKVLEDMKIKLSSGDGGGKVTMTSPDGQVYQVDASEVDEAEANGWSR